MPKDTNSLILVTTKTKLLRSLIICKMKTRVNFSMFTNIKKQKKIIFIIFCSSRENCMAFEFKIKKLTKFKPTSRVFYCPRFFSFSVYNFCVLPPHIFELKSFACLLPLFLNLKYLWASFLTSFPHIFPKIQKLFY